MQTDERGRKQQETEDVSLCLFSLSLCVPHVSNKRVTRESTDDSHTGWQVVASCFCNTCTSHLTDKRETTGMSNEFSPLLMSFWNRRANEGRTCVRAVLLLHLRSLCFFQVVSFWLEILFSQKILCFGSGRRIFVALRSLGDTDSISEWSRRGKFCTNCLLMWLYFQFTGFQAQEAIAPRLFFQFDFENYLYTHYCWTCNSWENHTYAHLAPVKAWVE